MAPPKRVLCIMDLSVAGRAGLSAALPVLAACGVQACGLPTALFSTHTAGFGPPERLDTAAFAADALAHFARLQLPFDALLTGYLASPAQFALAEAALAQYPAAFSVVDPAMADDGQLYGGLPDDVVQRMACLCAAASLITPNFTESALLAGEDPAEPRPDEAALTARMAALAGPARSVLVTSVPTPAGSEIRGCGPDGTGPWALPIHAVPQGYPGAGDAFTAALVGLVLQGLPLQAAARRAADFIARAAQATYAGGGVPRDGLWLEPALPLLAPPSPI